MQMAATGHVEDERAGHKIVNLTCDFAISAGTRS
jgi:hypothetical protein